MLLYLDGLQNPSGLDGVLGVTVLRHVVPEHDSEAEHVSR